MFPLVTEQVKECILLVSSCNTTVRKNPESVTYTSPLFGPIVVSIIVSNETPQIGNNADVFEISFVRMMLQIGTSPPTKSDFAVSVSMMVNLNFPSPQEFVGFVL